ncbi:hypothetical protein VM1G_04649 [Cytospora mali]|uniref:Cyclochlorotine biosynthesis protein O n=1 Tax=Cytospora mali TaxID=578113 RepID=A0A194VW29_CYTMA|nr:hypothetical protein VM1G_04649 [Valsa mali]
MSYHPVQNTEHDGSDTDIETGKFDTVGSSSSFGWKPGDKYEERHSGRFPSQEGLSASAPFIVTLIPWIINFILTIALVSLSWKTAESRTSATVSRQPATDLMYSLASDQIEYRVESTYASQDSPVSDYQGWPDDVKDKLWDEYEKGNRIRIDRKEAEKLPRATERVPLEEYKDDYVVGLGVFHNLHCLSTIRRGFYPHRYNSSLLDEDGNVDYHKWNHIDHCIETIRRALTCHADTAAMTFDWVEDSSIVLHPEITHTCRNFDVIRDWAYERHVPVHQRSHVEDGKVVDYVGKPYGPAWDKVKVVVPEDWAYTEHDL